MIAKNFVRIARTVFEKIEKSKNGRFLVIFGLILAIFLRSQSYNFDLIAHRGAPLSVLNFIKVVWTIFEKFDTFIERLGGKNKVRVHA